MLEFITNNEPIIIMLIFVLSLIGGTGLGNGIAEDAYLKEKLENESKLKEYEERFGVKFEDVWTEGDPMKF